jgi:hypothetical protein
MKLYGFFRSSASYRARIALNVKGLAYESVEVDLRAGASAQRSAQFLAMNPEGLVPVLVDRGHVISCRSPSRSTWRRRTRCPRCCPRPRPSGRACVR